MTASSTAAMRDLVPMAHVADIRRSVEFYGHLGFQVIGKYEPEGQLKWAHLRSGGAELMLSLATEPVNAAMMITSAAEPLVMVTPKLLPVIKPMVVPTLEPVGPLPMMWTVLGVLCAQT